MADLEIRPATRADLPGVLALYAQPGYDDGDVMSVAEAEAQLARFARYPNYTLYVAVDGAGAVVGTFALLIMDRIGHRGSPSAVVDDVAVAPDRQGAGIGRRMMQVAMARARAAGCYKLMLSSNLKRTDAHAFYDRLGFERHGYSYVAAL
jgi:GNAT superfamily N-acetyltransferase